jgi:hypothetical protein
VLCKEPLSSVTEVAVAECGHTFCHDCAMDFLNSVNQSPNGVAEASTMLSPSSAR